MHREFWSLFKYAVFKRKEYQKIVPTNLFVVVCSHGCQNTIVAAGILGRLITWFCEPTFDFGHNTRTTQKLTMYWTIRACF